MPKGQYETAERTLWTVERIRETVAAFQARSGRLPQPSDRAYHFASGKRRVTLHG